jgi:GNAT superfamily N-acetyltransferase
MPIAYAREQDLSADDYIAVVETTYMREKRPLANRDRIEAMLRGSNVIITARDEIGVIVGLARGVSDGAWVCYLADVVIRADRQGAGIGRGLVDACAEILGPKIGIVLLAFEPAVPFYRRLGMGEMQGFFRDRQDSS